jgi:glycosyltransferase involved in cell wall biosynthesis
MQSISTRGAALGLEGEEPCHRALKVLVVCTIDATVRLLLAAQIRALEEAGYTVHVACADGPGVPALVRDGFQMRPLKMVRRVSLLTNLNSLIGLYRLMRRERYDIVHVHTFSAAGIGRVAARLAGVPVILYTFRGFAFHAPSQRLLRAFNLSAERFCRWFTDFFFSQSEENNLLAIKYGVVDGERSLVIGNGVSLEEFADAAGPAGDAAAIRAELGLPASAMVIGMVCRLVREKGVREFFEAAVRISAEQAESMFLIVGDVLQDRDGISHELHELVEQHGLRHRFVFTGFRSDTARLYRAMDIFVLPSYREGMPRSVIEAMASGKPVVASDIPGCREEVVHGETGLLVPAKDSSKLGDALLTLLRDPSLMRGMGRAGRERAAELFDERRVCEKLVGAYGKIVSEKLGRSSEIHSHGRIA